MLQRSGLSEPHRVELAGMVDRQADRLRTMVEDLLTAARLEFEEPPPVRPVDVAVLVRQLAGEFAAAHKEVTVVAPLSAVAEGIPEALHRVLANLVENACKHGRPPVTVRVEDGIAGYIDVCVIDEGEGIPAEVRERVFERFFRLDANRAIPGIGLGLSIVQALVATCGGKVWIEDPTADTGPGTVVRVRLRAS
jgi:two-component system OmpR family sensor kinase